MNICFASFRYPGPHNKSDWAFVKQLVDAVAAMGNNCYVLSPYNINHYRRFASIREKYSVGKGSVIVYRPWYLSFSKIHFKDFYLSDWFHKRALSRAFRMLKIKPDVIYCHFWNACYEAYPFAMKNNIPLFVASGESEISAMFKTPPDIEEFSKYVRGVICVSSKNKEESINMGLTTPDKCGVFPNAVNSSLFYKRNKKECRDQLGFPQDAFIAAFVGWFNERKGPNRVAKAIDKLDDVKSIFVGKGDLEPTCNGILFKGALPHNMVPVYLCASDLFVLPTRHEGCCNAVVEAMACGLPIVSSNLPFNWDVLDSTNSIMVNPDSVDEITEAIRTLKDSPSKCEELSKESLRKAQSLKIEQRASSILDFMKKKIK